MNTLQPNQVKEMRTDGGHVLISWIKAHLTQISEWFWFCCSFLLFLALGPFSAVVVLLGLKSLGSEEQRQEMIEPARL
ncbi:hypothetical protein [Desulfogranum mediterraneum]|uniref:hypothetical protein n=1 Tax=Desulfogranum mediterraneum TaxID=160661 RepID=UPI00040E59D5|nr:hypothetical protein [Desulfogranum mediterraneum]